MSGAGGGMVIPGITPFVPWKLVVLVGAGVVAIMLLVGLVNLFVNPRTRPWGVLLLAVPLVILGGLWVTIWVAHVPPGRGPVPDEVAAQKAAEAMLRPGAWPEPKPWPEPKGDGLTVIVSPPDEARPGKPVDDGISVKIQQDGPTGKGTIIYVKANRMLEALGKTLLDTIRDHGSEKKTEPAGPTAPPAQPVAAAGPPPHVPGPDTPPAKPARAAPSKPSPAAAAKTAPRLPAKPPAAKRTPPRSAASEETVTGYGKTAADSEDNLDLELQKAFSQYAERRLGSEGAGEVSFPAEEIRKFIVDTSQEEVESGLLGPIIRTTAVVNFDKAYQSYRLSQRLWYLGGGLGVVLLMLSVIYGYLKIDLATAGAYRWRLRLAAAGIVLGTAAAAVAFLSQ
jgi:hypothetical protein